MNTATNKYQPLFVSILLISLCGLPVANGNEREDVKSTTTSANPTNTRNNKDYKSAPVADDQAKASNDDVEITRLIRSEINNIDSLSINAKNVKIITDKGRVTLRGPVNSQDEANTIAETAKKHAINNQVNNKLKVKTAQ